MMTKSIMYHPSSHHMLRMSKRAIFRLKSSLSPSLSISILFGADYFETENFYAP